MGKFMKPRKREGRLDLDLTVRDGKVNLLAKEGNTPIMKIKDGKFRDLNDVLEMLNKKL